MENIMAKGSYSYTCQACVVYERAKFISSNYKETNDHIFNHLEMSRKESELKERRKKEEHSEDDEDIFEGFDEDGNRIALILL